MQTEIRLLLFKIWTIFRESVVFAGNKQLVSNKDGNIGTIYSGGLFVIRQKSGQENSLNIEN